MEDIYLQEKCANQEHTIEQLKAENNTMRMWGQLRKYRVSHKSWKQVPRYPWL